MPFLYIYVEVIMKKIMHKFSKRFLPNINLSLVINQMIIHICNSARNLNYMENNIIYNIASIAVKVYI